MCVFSLFSPTLFTLTQLCPILSLSFANSLFPSTWRVFKYNKSLHVCAELCVFIFSFFISLWFHQPNNISIACRFAHSILKAPHQPSSLQRAAYSSMESFPFFTRSRVTAASQQVKNITANAARTSRVEKQSTHMENMNMHELMWQGVELLYCENM